MIKIEKEINCIVSDSFSYVDKKSLKRQGVIKLKPQFWKERSVFLNENQLLELDILEPEKFKHFSQNIWGKNIELKEIQEIEF